MRKRGVKPLPDREHPAAQVCIGFGEREGVCGNPAGSSHSPLWCQECDDERRAHITAQLDRLTAIFEARSVSGGTDPATSVHP